MTNEQEEIARSIQVAQTELEHALAGLEKLPIPELAGVQITAHALRNYLAIARGFTQLLQKELVAYPIREVQTWLDSLQRATALMLETTTSLEPSAVPAVTRIKWEVIDLDRLLTRFCEHYREKALAKGLGLLFESTAISARVFTDRVMVASILESLFSNAVKYSPAGTRIKVRLEDQAGSVLCQVCDEGAGLSLADQARLFEPGARLASRPTGGEESTGYGLVVARQLADRLGITIGCTSQLGAGCCFWLALPRPVEERARG